MTLVNRHPRASCPHTHTFSNIACASEVSGYAQGAGSLCIELDVCHAVVTLLISEDIQ